VHAFTLAQDLLNRPSPLSEADAPGRARMRQCITLALLLHLWLVVVFGTAPGGSAESGEGAWGALSVRLQGPANAGSPDVTAPADSGPVGEAKQQRSGGTVRPQSSQALDQAGAEKTGQWKAVENPNEPLLTDSTTPLVSPVTSGALANVTPSTPSVNVPTLPSAALDQVQPMSTARLADAPATRAEAPKAAPIAKPSVTQSTEVPSLAVPNLDSVKPLSTATLSATGTPTPAPAKAAEKLTRLAPAAPHNDLSQLNTPSLEGVKPMSTATLDAASASSAAEALRHEKAATMSKLEAAKTAAQDIGAAPKLDVAAPVAGSPSPGQSQRPAVASGGSPNAGAQQGHDVATAPSAAASKAPLNLSLPSRGPLARAGSGSGMLAVVPNPPETEDAMKKAIKKGDRPDCRKAYSESQMGLLAALPIAIDTLRDKGCKF